MFDANEIKKDEIKKSDYYKHQVATRSGPCIRSFDSTVIKQTGDNKMQKPKQTDEEKRVDQILKTLSIENAARKKLKDDEKEKNGLAATPLNKEVTEDEDFMNGITNQSEIGDC